MASVRHTAASLGRQLRALGVEPGQILQVHIAFSQVGPVEGGPEGLIAALSGALGPGGTLVMPSMTSDDDRPFDPQRTPCQDMGVTADTFWRRPGVVRSDSPHAFAAVGSQAARITAPHPVAPPHGVDSPAGRVWELGGHVLLLGVGHEANTTLHLAETLAGVRYSRPAHATVMRDGAVVRVDYAEADHCCRRFALVDGWLKARRMQATGIVGNAHARLAATRDIVSVALERLLADETVFLHPPGVDDECDEAWASMPSPPK